MLWTPCLWGKKKLWFILHFRTRSLSTHSVKWSNYSDKTTTYCKTCFDTSEWFWHAKNHLVKLQKKLDLGRPPLFLLLNPRIFLAASLIPPWYFKSKNLENPSKNTVVYHIFLFLRSNTDFQRPQTHNFAIAIIFNKKIQCNSTPR